MSLSDLDALAELWLQEPQLSMSEIGARLGVSRGVVAGAIDRARRLGDTRLKPRPPKPKAAPAPRVRSVKTSHEVIGNAPPPARARPATFDRLARGQCKFAVNNAARGQPHLFCAKPVSKPGSNWCPEHERAVATRGGGKPCVPRSAAARLR